MTTIYENNDLNEVEDNASSNALRYADNSSTQKNLFVKFDTKFLNFKYGPRTKTISLIKFIEGKISESNFYISNGCETLAEGKLLKDYCFNDNQILFCHLRLYGGKGIKLKDILFQNDSLAKMERDVLCSTNTLELQSSISYIAPIVDSLFGSIPTYDSESIDTIIKLVEDISLFIYDIANSKCKSNYILAFTRLTKSRTNKPIVSAHDYERILRQFQKIFGSELQSSDEENVFSDLRGIFDKFESIQESTIYKKMYKFIMYMLANSIFENFGLSMNNMGYTRVEQEAMKKQYHKGTSFYYTIADTLMFLCERGYQCMLTGTMDPIFHSSSAYEEWFTKATELKMEANFLTNPEPVLSKTRFEFFHDLNDAIEKGEAIAKHVNAANKYEKKMVSSLLADLKMIKSVELTKSASQKERKAPFSVLVHGGSSVAKSTFTKMLYYHYGKIFNLPTADEYKYTRNAVDPYWVNFNSTQWAVVLDDIAFMNPNSASSGDPSLLEMLQVVNNVPFVPVQADLADKGRTPLVSRFVIATTNTMHLNAHNYFACPYAVQRRFPYVISIKPKSEYVKESGMIDPSKMELIQEGEYPDYWEITILAAKLLENDKTEYVEKQVFSNVYEFLHWFSLEATKFEKVQDKALECGKIMSRVELCEDCYLPNCKCVCLQDGEEEDDFSPWAQQIILRQRRMFNYNFEIPTLPDTGFVTNFKAFVFKYFMTNFLFSFILSCISSKLGACILSWCCKGDLQMQRNIMKYLGTSVQNKIGKPTKIILTILTSLTAVYSLLKVYEKFNKIIFSTQTSETGETAKPTCVSTVGRKPTGSDDEKKNVWHNDDYVVSTFDVSPKTLSWNGLKDDMVFDKIYKNCVVVKLYYVNGEGKDVFRYTKAICVKGRTYMMNAHCLSTTVNKIELIVDKVEGVSANFMTMLDINSFNIDRSRDVAFFKASLPAKKSIIDLFAKKSLYGKFEGNYVSRDMEGHLNVKSVGNIQLVEQMNQSDLPAPVDIWMGHCDPQTEKGDCGSVLVVRNGYGPIILGMHVLGNTTTSGALRISQDYIKDKLEEFEIDSIEISEPLLNAPGTNLQLGPLHYKSTLRYLEEGTAIAYGSITGFRPRRKSNVVPTYICEEVLKYDYDVKNGPPLMNSWKPFHLAITDMVRPVTMMNPSHLRDVRKNFVKDILSELDPHWLKQIMVYDMFTAINGAQGVTFVDKLNRNTSMGNPWKKSKRYYLHDIAPQHGMDHPVDFDDAVISRVQNCLEKYHQGKRYMPVFCAHLKDEPVSFKKINLGKTRVFTGAPVDWSIVVRMYLLSVVRVIQMNKTIFESAPGTVAQSIEWSDLRDYITKYGDTRMIAGDYGKFDKRMPACVITEAFGVLKDICAAAGYTDEDLKVIDCIAEDTAYPLVDFNGDLIQFYGSNPSGHPLTVIINGIANSIYMRYTYFKLNPAKECYSFRKNVALLTYGDDNVMGVKKNTSWFNHTSISNCLREIDIVYTMADKEAESIPYIGIEDISFLKRRWVFDKDVGAYLCPIEHESIEKMLTRCVKSKTVSAQHQAISIITTAVHEYFFYGKDIFFERTELLKDIVEKCNLQLYVEKSTFPTWESLKDNFWSA